MLHQEPFVTDADSSSELYERLRGPNQWPPSGPLRPALEAHAHLMNQLGWALSRAIARAVGFGSNGFDDFLGATPHWQVGHTPVPQISRSLRYSIAMCTGLGCLYCLGCLDTNCMRVGR